MRNKNIPRDQWTAFCADFTRRHQGWPATIEVLEHGTIQTVVRDMSLISLSADLREGHEDVVSVMAGNGPGRLMTHMITAPSEIKLQLTDQGADEGVRVESETGMTTLVRFKTTVLTEEEESIPLEQPFPAFSPA